jgi:co-chaperonin GroES (HSP10)
MRASKTKGGLLLPDTVKDPQGYGRVISVGEIVSEATDIKEGDFLVYHPMAGMDMLMDKRILKVLKYEELYGILQDDSIKESLDVMQIGANSEGTPIIQPVSKIIQ